MDKPFCARNVSSNVARPSAVLNPKTVDPFQRKPPKKGASAPISDANSFATAYEAGRIPCRISHGSVKHKLMWTIPIDEVPWDPTIVYFAEGLKETVYPYCPLAPEGFVQMLQRPDAPQNMPPLLPRVMDPIRAVLMQGSNTESLCNAFKALIHLSNAVGKAMNPHLKIVIQPLARKLNDKKLHDSIMECISVLDANGGKEAYSIIKQKIPTYCGTL